MRKATWNDRSRVPRFKCLLLMWILCGVGFYPLFVGSAAASDTSFLSPKVQPPIMLGLGDSAGEGVQSAEASTRTQPFSYLAFLARQIGVPFSLPLIQSGPLGVVGEPLLRSRLLPSLQAFNLAVSGADVNALLHDRADAITEDDIDSETDLVLFPRLGSQIEIAESVGAPLIICWIGNNDVLSAILTFDQLDASQMTPVEAFTADFQELVQRLHALGSVVVFGNIPNVTQIGFLLDREDLIRFLGSDFGLPEGHLTTIVAMFLIRLGLADGSLLANPNFVLDAREIGLIQQRIETFNQIIADAATSIGMPVVDVNALLAAVATNPPVIEGVSLRPRYLGGFFSLDGVHPSNIAHAILANAFLQTINTHLQTHIPPMSEAFLRFILLTDPWVDKDSDNVVRGRLGAGLLETLGPFLGISGDVDDFTAVSSWTGINARRGRQFIERFLTLQGRDPQEASVWKMAEVLDVFRQLFGIGPE